MRTRNALVLATALAVTALGCSRDDTPTGLAGNPTDGRVFIDNFIAADFQAFGGSKLDALSLDNVTKYRGSAALKFRVPAPGDPTGGYAGGAFVASAARDLTKYDALTFYAKASIPVTLNVAGIGNDNTGTSLFNAQREGIALTTSWQKYTIAIPLPSRLTAERGLFFLAEGAEGSAAYDIWLDDIRFETLGTVTNPRPTLAPTTLNAEVGGTAQIGGLGVTMAVAGVDQTLGISPSWFSFASSNSAVATVNGNGRVTALSAGTTNITATLGGTPAVGTVAVATSAPPTAAAAAPTRLAADVISLFSGSYTNVAVDTWSASWDQADVTDVTIAGNAVKRYGNFVYAGIEMTTTPVNATAMGGLHLDVYATNASTFKVKLVNFGANGVFGGGDDSESEVTLTPTSSPAMTAGAWSSLDIPLSAFGGLTGRSKIAQIVLSGSSATTYIDNVYFYKLPLPTEPPAAAPTPTAAAANVISLFSNAYTNVPVTTWSADWDQADVTDVTIGGNATKKYTNFTFAGIEFPTIDATAMTHFNFDYWTPDATGAGAELKVKLVDFGANGAFGGGDDTEHELTYTSATTPGIKTGEWVTFSIPLSAFTGMTARGHVAQLIFVSGPDNVFLDNIYFSNNGGGGGGGGGGASAPTTAAPTPTYAAGDVISLFSNAYTNATVNTWSADWDQADVSDVQIAGNDTKRYANLTFAGIEFTAPTINATTMTHFRLDIWTPDASAAPAAFKVKLVDFGANGAFAGGDDVEHELTFEATTTPALGTGAWITLDIPLSQFTGLTTRGHMAQLIFVGVDPINTVFVDNILFHK